MIKKKIGLIGCPGTGRTGYALELSKELDIPNILSRHLTKPILERDDYNYADESYVEHFLAIKSREFELFYKRVEIEEVNESFVTDRTTLEQFAYSLLRLDTYTEEDINLFQKICSEHLTKYTHLFYFPRTNDIKNNGLRTVNVYFQMQIDFIIKGLLKEWDVEYISIPEHCLDTKSKIKFMLSEINK